MYLCKAGMQGVQGGNQAIQHLSLDHPQAVPTVEAAEVGHVANNNRKESSMSVFTSLRTYTPAICASVLSPLLSGRFLCDHELSHPLMRPHKLSLRLKHDFEVRLISRIAAKLAQLAKKAKHLLRNRMLDVTMLDHGASPDYPQGQYQLPEFMPARSRSRLTRVAPQDLSHLQHDNGISSIQQVTEHGSDQDADVDDVATEQPMDICPPEPQSLHTLWPAIYDFEPLSIKRKPVGEPIKTTTKPSRVYDVRPPTNNHLSQQSTAVEQPKSPEVWASAHGVSTRPRFADSAQISDTQMSSCFSTPSKAPAPQSTLSSPEEKAKRKAARSVERQKLQAELATLEKARKQPMRPPVLRALAPKKLRNKLLKDRIRKAIDPEGFKRSEWTRPPKLETAFESRTEFSVDGFVVPRHLRSIVQRDVFDLQHKCSHRPFGPRPTISELPRVAPAALADGIASALNNGNDVVRYAHTYQTGPVYGSVSDRPPVFNQHFRLPSNFAPFTPNHALHRPPVNTELHALRVLCASRDSTTKTRRYYSKPEHQYLPSIAAHSTLTPRMKDPMYALAAQRHEHDAQHAKRKREHQAETTRRLGGIMTGLKKRLGPEAQHKRVKFDKLPMHQQPMGGCNSVRGLSSSEKAEAEKQTMREEQAEKQQEAGKKDEGTKLLDEYEAAFHVWESKISLENGGKAVGWWEDRWKEPEMKTRFAVQEIPKFGGGGGGGGATAVVKKPGTEAVQRDAKSERPVSAFAPVPAPVPVLRGPEKELQKKPPMEAVLWKLPLLGKLVGRASASEEHSDDFEI
jgi:hypothetical protein